MWEGYDEWAHFAYIQHVAEHGQLPARSENVSDEIQRSLELVPLSHSAAEAVPAAVTHDGYWRLTESDRLRRELELRRLSAAYTLPDASERRVTQYEAQQPPLYYLLLTMPYLAVQHWSLPAQVLTLRVISLMIAGIALLLAYAIARQVAVVRHAAIGIVILFASLPGILIDVCRVGNDCLAITIGSTVILCSLQILKRNSGMYDWIALGGVLAAALLTKAYDLAFLPLLSVLVAVQIVRRRSIRKTARGALTAFLIAASAAGWWYWRSWFATGTLSGEQIDAAAAPAGLAGKLQAIGSVQWLRVLDSAAASHIWTGGWSFLVVRSWMYRVFELLAVAVAIGLAILAAGMVVKKVRRRAARNPSAAQLAVIASAYLFACLGLAYYALVVFLTKNVSVTLGWYLYFVISAELVLLASGFVGLSGLRRSARCLAGITLIVLAFDLYTMHFVLVPYYSGLIYHRPSGSLTAFHLVALSGTGLREIAARLSLNESSSINPTAIASIWAGYLCATAALMAYSAGRLVGATSLGSRRSSRAEPAAPSPSES
jgi:hypothetical protein